jgi:hypothetical protein
LFAPEFTLSSTGTLRVDDSTLTANQVNNGGTLSIGSSPGLATIDGDYTQTGTLEIEIGGLIPGMEFDHLQVTGTANIGGSVVFPFINGFAPTTGDLFEFLSVTGETDLSSATFEVRNLAPGFEFDITPTAGGFQLVALNDGTFVPEPASALLFLLALPLAVSRNCLIFSRIARHSHGRSREAASG